MTSKETLCSFSLFFLSFSFWGANVDARCRRQSTHPAIPSRPSKLGARPVHKSSEVRKRREVGSLERKGERGTFLVGVNFFLFCRTCGFSSPLSRRAGTSLCGPSTGCSRDEDEEQRALPRTWLVSLGALGAVRRLVVSVLLHFSFRLLRFFSSGSHAAAPAVTTLRFHPPASLSSRALQARESRDKNTAGGARGRREKRVRVFSLSFVSDRGIGNGAKK